MSSSRRLFPEQRDEDDEEEEETYVNTNDALVKAAAAATTRVIILLRSFGIYLFFVVCTQNLSYFIEEKNTMQSDPARASLSLSLSLFGPLETLLNAAFRPSTWYQYRQLWLRKVNDIDASSRVAQFFEALKDLEASILVEYQSRWWIENRRRRWLEHVENARERRRLDEEDEEEEEEHEDGYYRCGDLYWLYAMLAMLLELESSIEESAFIVSGGANIVGEEGERERRRWRRECEYLEEDVRESIGLEAAPHRILMRRERERARSLLSSESNSSDDDDEEEDERARRSRRQHYPIHGNTNSSSSRSGLHPVSFRVERRESVPLRVVPPEMAAAAVVDTEAEAEDMFSNRVITATEGIRRRSSVDFLRDPPRGRHVVENDAATPDAFARPTDILETVYSSFDAHISGRSLREAQTRIARAAREGIDASEYLTAVMSSQQTLIVNSSSINAPLNRHRRYRHHLRASCRLEDEHEDDEQQNQHLKNEITQLKDKIDKLEKASTCVICYSNPRSCALLPCCHFTTCHECANRSRERFVEETNDEDEDGDGDENDGDRKSKKNEIFFRCPTCRGNVTGVLQVFPP